MEGEGWRKKSQWTCIATTVVKQMWAPSMFATSPVDSHSAAASIYNNAKGQGMFSILRQNTVLPWEFNRTGVFRDASFNLRQAQGDSYSAPGPPLAPSLPSDAGHTSASASSQAPQ